MFKMSLFVLLSITTISIFGTQAHAATYNVAGGELIGAFDVEVDGISYDVMFSRGSCITLFNGCDSPSDFLFGDQPSALQASVALQQQVFGAGDIYDLNPQLTNGCDFFSVCYLITPYNTIAQLVMLENGPGVVDLLFNDFLNPTLPSNTFIPAVYAVWSVSPVPIPAAIWLFGTALIGLVGISKRSKAA